MEKASTGAQVYQVLGSTSNRDIKKEYRYKVFYYALPRSLLKDVEKCLAESKIVTTTIFSDQEYEKISLGRVAQAIREGNEFPDHLIVPTSVFPI